ncbi:hypothetical protein PAXINDRAFT_158202 [Paxillus involutus ATCC 200175]|uniref:Uncharacterized protein n=1 Tax=Paxillus involutus ATCC 200175 TaxID=664439 RepID=A0A0C9SNN1_PAXIN|nr:hypothetical protein PAXINDRAFT_158202 [Paxillus involutus ATCC 200175]
MWEVRCPHEECEAWVKIGIKSRIPLSISGHFTNLEAHVGSKTCGRTSSGLQMVAQNSRIALASLFPQCSQPSSVPKTTVENDTSTCVLAPAHARALLSCPGILLDETNWPVVPGIPIEANFPWLRRRPGQDQLSFKVELFNDALAVRSFDCDARAGQNGAPCLACDSLLPKLQAVASNASEHKSHTRKSLLTPLQLIEDNQNLVEQVNRFKLQSSNT